MGEPPLLAAVRERAEEAPDRVAVRVLAPGGGGPALTRAGLLEAAGGFAALLADRPGGIVAVHANRSPLGVAAMLGALAAGRAFVFLHRPRKGPGLRDLVLRCGGPVLADPACRPALAGLDLPREILLDLEAPPRSDGPLPARALAGPTAAVLFTSGSTGEPKGVRISAADLAARARAEADLFGLGPEDVLLGLLPFSFDVGLNQLCAALVAGAELALLPSWLPADVVAAVAERGVTGISAVPLIWSSLADAGMALPAGRLRYATVSGGDLDPAGLRALPALAGGAGIFKTYGQTETFRSTCLLPREFAERSRSVGRPFAGARVRVVRGDGTDCAPGEEGEVVHSGTGTMLGYLGEDGPPPREVRTGDRGRTDEAGYLFLSGRTDDMVKVHGLRAYPAEVGEGLLRLPAVREACAVAVRTGAGEPRFVAFYATERGGPDEAQALRGLRSVLPPHLLPARAVRLDRLPRTESGKPDRRALLERARELIDTQGEP